MARTKNMVMVRLWLAIGLLFLAWSGVIFGFGIYLGLKTVPKRSDSAVIPFPPAPTPHAKDTEGRSNRPVPVPVLDQHKFVIQAGHGLAHYVGYRKSIDLAEVFGLPIYLGRHQKAEYRITPEHARRLESVTDRLQITVGVNPGDSFDLGNKKFTPAKERR